MYTDRVNTLCKKKKKLGINIRLSFINIQTRFYRQRHAGGALVYPLRKKLLDPACRPEARFGGVGVGGGG